MSDYIKRGYAKTAICSSCANPCSLAEKANNPCVTVIELERIPSADVAPVRHGIWERELGAYFGGYPRFVYHCSICGYAEEHAYADSKCSNYCPNCGAKMDEEKDDEL